MPSINKKISKKRSSASHGGGRSIKKRNSSKPKRRRSSAPTRKRSASRQRVNFYCMKCKTHSPSVADRYEKRGGAMFAKGRCDSCDTKMSLIVKADSIPSRSAA